MDAAPEPFPDAAAMQAELGARVAARRAAGEYPAGLEEALDEHYHRVVHRPREPQVASLTEAFDRFLDGATYRVPAPAFTSGMPGGTKLHALISSTVVRHTQDLVLQLDQHARLEQDVFSWLLQVVDDLQREHEHLRGHIEVLYEEQVALRARLAALEER
jgi:hypothetical protein